MPKMTRDRASELFAELADLTGTVPGETGIDLMLTYIMEHPEHPFYSMIEADDGKAAQNWRRQQLRALQSWSKTSVRSASNPLVVWRVSGMYRNPFKGPDEQGSVTLARVMGDPEMKREVLIKRIERWKKDGEAIRQMAGAFDLSGYTEEALDNITTLLARAATLREDRPAGNA